MLDINHFATALARDSEGIWFAHQFGRVSYPEGGHAACLAVEDGSFWFRHRNRCILAAVQRYHSSDLGPVFDIGGGNGFVAKGLADAGYEVVLVEPGPEGARNARDRGLLNVVCANTEMAGFKPRSMPAIGLFDVVEHLTDDQAFLKDMAALLEPNGKLFVTVPAYQWLWSQEDIDAGHYRRYTRQSISNVLGKSGFAIEYATCIFRPLPLPILLLRALPDRLGLRRDVGSSAKVARDHAVGAKSSMPMLERMLAGELMNVAAGRPMAFGGSVLVVASRVTGG